MAVILRWYTDGKPDDKVPYPFLTDASNAPMEFACEADAIDWIGTSLLFTESRGYGWRVVPLGAP
jgi:hypothetical protein